MTDLRAAVYGFLGMQPQPVAGSPADGSAPRRPPTALMSATEATNRIAAAGALLSHSDALYRSVRRSLATTPGHGSLPASVWVTNPQLWQVGAVAAQLDLVAHVAHLGADAQRGPAHGAAEPPGAAHAARRAVERVGPQPDLAVEVTVVVANEGTLDEPNASVRLSLANQSSGATATRVETAVPGLRRHGGPAPGHLRRQAGHGLRAHGPGLAPARAGPDGQYGLPAATPGRPGHLSAGTSCGAADGWPRVDPTQSWS